MQYSHESELGFLGPKGNKLSYRFTRPNSLNCIDTPIQGVLLLHGASSSKGRGKVLFEQFQDYLASNNISSLAFDTRGVGTSEGEYADSTLEHRLKMLKQHIGTYLIRLRQMRKD